MTFKPGDVVRVYARWQVNGVDTDPSPVKLYVKKKSASSETVYVYLQDATIVRDSAGNFHADIPAEAPPAGKRLEPVRFRWEGGGPATKVKEGRYIVKANEL